MAYENPLTVSYSFGSLSFATTPAAGAIKPPVGKKMGKVKQIHVSGSVLFTQVTTPAYVRVGTAGDNDKYGELNIGALAATDAATRSAAEDLAQSGAAFLIDMTADSISQVEVTFVAPTGGTPAGTGIPTIVIDWF